MPDGSRWQVSVNGGTDSRWRGDGGELYWISRGDVTAGTVDLSSGAFRITDMKALFTARSSDYAVDSKGEVFYIKDSQTSAISPVVIRTEWQAAED